MLRLMETSVGQRLQDIRAAHRRIRVAKRKVKRGPKKREWVAWTTAELKMAIELRTQWGDEWKDVADALGTGRTARSVCVAVHRYLKGEKEMPQVTVGRHPLYGTWSSMKTRCTKPSHKDYPNYGGRGVTVCARWSESFENFLTDMGPRPSPEHTLERRDNNGSYEKGNCVWALRTAQARNRRGAQHMLTYQGRTQCLAAWAEELGFRDATIRQRIKDGWSIERALTTPKSLTADRTTEYRRG